MEHNVIINGMMYPPCTGNKKYWKVLEKKEDGKGIHSLRRKSDGQAFTIGDDVALTWYETFSTPHVITGFIKHNGLMYVEYNHNSMWELTNTRKVTKDEINNAIRRGAEKVAKYLNKRK